MPYNELERKLFLDTKGTQYFVKGDLNRDFTKAMIRVMSHSLNYNTIHDIGSTLINPSEIKEIQAVYERHKDKDKDLVRMAHFTAYMEFYRRIAVLYEDGKARINGDIYADLVRKVGEKLVADSEAVEANKNVL